MRLRHPERCRIGLGHRVAGAKRFLQQDGEPDAVGGGIVEQTAAAASSSRPAPTLTFQLRMRMPVMSPGVWEGG